MMSEGSVRFREGIQNGLTFTAEAQKDCTLWRNVQRPELGYNLQYERQHYYSFGVADYTVAQDFTLPFAHELTILRFGLFRAGRTEYQMEGKPVSFTTPSSFFVVESSVQGMQRWQKGQHFEGLEFWIYEPYFTDVVVPLYPDAALLHRFEKNHTYHYLPEEIIRIIEQTATLAKERRLTGIYLESKILECIAILTSTVNSSPDNAFTFQLDYGDIRIGNNRRIRLLPSDIKALQACHSILSEEVADPPSIAQLSKRVFLNEQKLKAGFSHYYRVTIGEFVHSVRMTKAANLLSTTDLSIEVIGRQVGYRHSGNFSRMFKRTYGKNPLDFRRSKAH